VHGKWCYLYRAIDADGHLVDSRLSEMRNMEAAQQFFKQAGARVGHAPDQVTTDGHRSYPRAICETMGSNVQHRTNKYLNNRLQPGPSRDQAAILSDAWCAEASRQQPESERAFDELRNYFRPRLTFGETVPLLEQRQAFRKPLAALQTLLQAAS
jgi:putative transposase